MNSWKKHPMPLKGDAIPYIFECYTIMIDIKFLLEVLRTSEEKLWYLKCCHRKGSHMDKTKLKEGKEGQEKVVSSPTTGR